MHWDCWFGVRRPSALVAVTKVLRQTRLLSELVYCRWRTGMNDVPVHAVSLPWESNLVCQEGWWSVVHDFLVCGPGPLLWVMFNTTVISQVTEKTWSRVCECCSRSTEFSLLIASSLASSRIISPLSNLVCRQESTMWLLVWGSLHEQFVDCVSPHLYREALQGPWPVWKRFNKDH